MIFIKPEDNQSIFISKHTDGVGPYKLVLKHNLTNEDSEFDNLTNSGYKSGYLVFINLDFRYLNSGEHTYNVYDSTGSLLESGLLQVMTTLKETISYKKNTEKIIYNK